MSKKTSYCGFLFAGIFILLAFIMYCTPRSSDDFEFLSLNLPSIKSLIRYALYYGNGRALGNITAVIFNKMPALAIIAKAGIITGVIFLLPRVLNYRGLRYDLFSFMLVLCVNPALFGEVYTWNCGFANYMPPIFITLLIVYLLQNHSRIKNGFVNMIVFLAVFGLGCAEQLFVEHTAVINVVLAASFTLYYFKHKKSEKYLALTWLTATVIGICAMLLIPKVFYTANNRTGNYRSVNIGNIGELLESCVNNAIILLDNCIGTFGLLISIGALITLYLTRTDRSKKAQNILTALVSFSLSFLLLSSFLQTDVVLTEQSFMPFIWPSIYNYVMRIITAVMALIPLVIWLCSARKNTRVFFLLSLSVISMLLLLAVSPTPTRVVFQSYLLVAMAFLCTLTLLPLPKKRFFTRVLVGGCCVMSLMLCTVFFNSHKMAKAREEYILTRLAKIEEVYEKYPELKDNENKPEVCIFKIPYRYVFWDSQWSMSEYYDPDYISDFVVVDYTVWHALYNPPAQ